MARASEQITMQTRAQAFFEPLNESDAGIHVAAYPLDLQLTSANEAVPGAPDNTAGRLAFLAARAARDHHLGGYRSRRGGAGDCLAGHGVSDDPAGSQLRVDHHHGAPGQARHRRSRLADMLQRRIPSVQVRGHQRARDRHRHQVGLRLQR